MIEIGIVIMDYLSTKDDFTLMTMLSKYSHKGKYCPPIIPRIMRILTVERGYTAHRIKYMIGFLPKIF